MIIHPERTASDGPGVARFSDRGGKPIRHRRNRRNRRNRPQGQIDVNDAHDAHNNARAGPIARAGPNARIARAGPSPFVWEKMEAAPRRRSSIAKLAAALAVGGLLAGTGTRMTRPNTKPNRPSTALVPARPGMSPRNGGPVRGPVRPRNAGNARHGILPIAPANSRIVPSTRHTALVPRLTNAQARALVEGNVPAGAGGGWLGGLGGAAGLAGLWRRLARRPKNANDNAAARETVRRMTMAMFAAAKTKNEERDRVRADEVRVRADEVRVRAAAKTNNNAKTKTNAKTNNTAKTRTNAKTRNTAGSMTKAPPMPPPLPPPPRGAVIPSRAPAPAPPPGPPPRRAPASRQASLDPLLHLLGIRTGGVRPPTSATVASTATPAAASSKRAILEAACLALETFIGRPGVSPELKDRIAKHLEFLRKERGKMGLILVSSPGAFVEALAVALGKVKHSPYDAYELDPTGRHLVFSADEMNSGRAVASVERAMTQAAAGEAVTPASLNATANRPRNQTNRSGVPRRVAVLHTLARQATGKEFRALRAAYLRVMYRVLWKVVPRDAPPAVVKQVDAVTANLRAFRRVRQVKAATAFFDSKLRVATGDVVRVIAAFRTRGQPLVGVQAGKDVSEFFERLKLQAEAHKDVKATAAEWAVFLRRARSAGMGDKLPLVTELMEPRALADARTAPRTYLNAAKSSRPLRGRV